MQWKRFACPAGVLALAFTFGCGSAMEGAAPADAPPPGGGGSATAKAGEAAEEKPPSDGTAQQVPHAELELGVVGGAGTGTGTGYGNGHGHLGGGGGGKTATVHGATAATSGDGLSPEIIQRTVQQSMGRVRLCYESAIDKDPTLAGQLAVKFTIDSQGAVSQAAAGDTNIANADMVSCVVSAVRGLSFPALSKGGAMVVTYPFYFSSGGQ